MENKKAELSRRDFGKLLAGIGASVAVSPFSGTAEAAEKNAQEMRVKYRTDKSPIEIDPSQIKRFNQFDQSFDRVRNEAGEDWWTASQKQVLKNVLEGKYSKDRKAESVAAARSSKALLDGSQAMWFPLGWSAHNESFYSWNPLSVAKELTPFHGGREPDEKNPETLTKQAKVAARFYGADLVGIAPLNENWLYSDGYGKEWSSKKIVRKNIKFPEETETELIIPEKMNNVIVMAVSMNREMMATGPSTMADAAAVMGYDRMYYADIALSEYIRALGYNAIPCANGGGLSVPMAVEAGLGQASRMGTIITPEYGPNVRLTKVITDMPLNHDKPIDFGVTEFCETCKKCARECPSKTITEGERSFTTRFKGSQPGVLKWQNNYDKCLRYWMESGTYCSVCLNVCPFTKGAMWGHKGVEWLIDNVRWLDPVMLGLDDGFGYGEHRKEMDIWNKTNIHTYGLDPGHLKCTPQNNEKDY